MNFFINFWYMYEFNDNNQFVLTVQFMYQSGNLLNSPVNFLSTRYLRKFIEKSGSKSNETNIVYDQFKFLPACLIATEVGIFEDYVWQILTDRTVPKLASYQRVTYSCFNCWLLNDSIVSFSVTVSSGI